MEIYYKHYSCDVAIIEIQLPNPVADNPDDYHGYVSYDVLHVYCLGDPTTWEEIIAKEGEQFYRDFNYYIERECNRLKYQ